MKLNPFILLLLLLAGCSQKDPEPEFLLSATVDGKAWNANLANNQNTNVGATITRDLVVVIAAQSVDNVTTGIGVVFPKNIALNTPVKLDITQNTTVVYTLSDTESYAVDPRKGTAGTVTVTRLDEIGGVVEGTFSGEAIHNRNGSKIQITNGRFRSALYATAVTAPPPGKK